MTLPGEENINRLILGTVQFGLAYGISNKRGQVTQQEVNDILARAKVSGIKTLDTAAAYGESEASLGSFFSEEKDRFQLISKYPPNKPDLSIADAFQQSLDKLRIVRLHGYLLHSFASYRSKPTIISELQELKKIKKVDKIGISLYHPQEALELMEKDVKVDVVQLPYSVFDRRFEEVLPLLRERGIETHVRSVYLQGLYFMAPHTLPVSLSPVASKLVKLRQLAKDYQLPLGAMLLGYVLSNRFISNVVVGVESLVTLQENIDYCYTTIPQKLIQELDNFQEDNEDLILPYNWTNK